MRSFLFLLFIGLLFASCGKDSNQEFAPLGPSKICTAISGNEGLIWDLHNGITRTDLPGGIPPQVNNIGGSYSNPTHPLLSFIYPVGYTPTTIPGSGTVGVVLIRNDNAVLWKYLQSTAPGFVAPRTIRDSEITDMKNFYGLQGANIDILCINEPPPVQLAVGLGQAMSSILYRVGDFTGMVITSSTISEGLNTTFKSVRKVSAPTSEFNDLSLDVFLALDWQLLIRNPDTILDSDLDGVPNDQDKEPFNPNVQ